MKGLPPVLITAIVLVFLVIRPFVVQAFYIPSGSMLNTLHVGDRILVNKFIYRFRPPERGAVRIRRDNAGHISRRCACGAGRRGPASDRAGAWGGAPV